MNFHKRAIGMLEAGASTADVAAQIGTSEQAVRSLRTRFAQNRTTDNLPQSGRHEPKTFIS